MVVHISLKSFYREIWEHSQENWLVKKDKLHKEYMDNLEEEIRVEIMDELDLSVDISDDELLVRIKEKIINKGRLVPISLKERKKIESHVFNSLRKLDVLEDLLGDEEITEIMINGPKTEE